MGIHLGYFNVINLDFNNAWLSMQWKGKNTEISGTWQEKNFNTHNALGMLPAKATPSLLTG